jgi:hypothetical protein
VCCTFLVSSWVMWLLSSEVVAPGWMEVTLRPLPES